jgi:hypothetical protein
MINGIDKIIEKFGNIVSKIIEVNLRIQRKEFDDHNYAIN